jgi:nitronate monooxygenase
MEKVQFPHLATIYGAMLAGMDCMIMGAGIPFQIPAILDQLAQHQPVSYKLDVENADPDDDYRIYFDPQELFPGIAEIMGPLKRPQFFPIVSSVVLAKALLKRSTGKIDGLVVEGYIAGGHNAPPRGPLNLSETGEPIYTEKDVVDLNHIAALGLPFWVAGGYGNPEGLQLALAAGAQGIQAGTIFAYSDESGMESTIKQKIIHKVLEDKVRVRTDPLASPTNYPFKVVELDDTLYDPEIYKKRQRICDIGMLRTLYKTKDKEYVLRCPSEPVDAYLKKGGAIEDTVGRQCLCNALSATGGQQQVRPDGYLEPQVVTSGDEINSIKRIIKPGQDHYGAADAVNFLLNGSQSVD